jgi:UPF0716 protein FxsA
MPLIALLILVVPVVELFVIVNVAYRIGFFETLGLLILISVVGAWLLKREGTAAWQRLRAALARGEVPTREAIDGALILFGGALLLTPGFLTDVVGLFLIFPGTRALSRSWARRVAGFLVVRRFGTAGAATSAGTRIHDARVTRSRRVDDAVTPDPGPAPSGLPHRPDEGGSPDTG